MASLVRLFSTVTVDRVGTGGDKEQKTSGETVP
jgi:hypothetical protein